VSLIPTEIISKQGRVSRPYQSPLEWRFLNNFFFATTMVTRTVIRITSSEAEHWAAIAAAVDNNAAAIEKIENKQSESSKNTTSPVATLDQDRGDRKRPLPLWRDNTNNQATVRRRRQQKNSFVIDLSGVPPQPPIPKSSGRAKKEGASKYTGVSFNKHANRWVALIMIEGKQRLIGYYDDEEDAAADYARALLKYKGGVKRQSCESFAIDLSDIPPQPPIPKSSGRIKGASKYTGRINGKQRCVLAGRIHASALNK
jgi:hypothetical protein